MSPGKWALGSIVAAVCMMAVIPFMRSSTSGAQVVKHEDEALLLEHYGQASSDQLISIITALQSELAGLTDNYYKQAFEAGRYEVSVLSKNEDGGYVLPRQDGLFGSRLMPNGELHLVMLPENGYARAHAISNEIDWLMRRTSEVQAFERRRVTWAVAK